MDIRPSFLIFLLCVLYWRVPRLLPHTARLARWALITVLVLMTPHAVYSTVCGYPSWSPNLPSWLLVLMLMAGVGTFLLFALGAVVLIIDGKRTP